MNGATASANHLASLRAEEYNRERWSPREGDVAYLHLSDLRQALEGYRSEANIKVLDIGSGGAPYRQLFPHSVYHCADTGAGPGIDFVIGNDGSTGALDSTYDLVLSTQVLEHVTSPQVYLAECRRVLKDGGMLLLSTHGVWEDHPCPTDFWRWTCSGLTELVRATGFEVERAQKLTTNGRMLVALLEGRRAFFPVSRKTVAGLAWWLLYRGLLQRSIYFHRWCDSFFSGCRVVSASETGHDLYMGVLLAGKCVADRSVAMAR